MVAGDSGPTGMVRSPERPYENRIVQFADAQAAKTMRVTRFKGLGEMDAEDRRSGGVILSGVAVLGGERPGPFDRKRLWPGRGGGGDATPRWLNRRNWRKCLRPVIGVDDGTQRRGFPPKVAIIRAENSRMS